jgi:FixJ family two-component response regulator
LNNSGALIYVVDHDVSAREGVAGLIRSTGLRVKTFASGEEFLAAPRSPLPSCLVLDVNLPGLSELDLQQELARSGVQVPIIFLTRHGDIPEAVRAIKAGAANVIRKPFDQGTLLNEFQQCLSPYPEDGIRPDQNPGDMLGKSPTFQTVLRDIEAVAPTDAAVLLQGAKGFCKYYGGAFADHSREDL